MLAPEVLLRWLLLFLFACDPSGGGTARDDESEDPRVRVLALCEESCEVRAAGDDCTDETYLDWCVSTCATIDGMLPESCLDEAETALLCWIEEDWYCSGETSYYGVDQPLPEDPEACETQTEAFYLCS